MSRVSLVLFILILFFTACSVEKQLYSTGYYFKKIYNSNRLNNTPAQSDIHSYRAPKNSILISCLNADSFSVENIVITENYTAHYNSNNQEQITLPHIDLCDELLMKDGTKKMVKIVSVTDTKIKYKKCEGDKGSIYALSKKKVIKINYANGESQDVVVEKPVPTEKYNSMAIASLVFGICGLVLFFTFGGIVLGPIAILMGFIGMAKIKEFNNQQKGKGMAIMGIIFGLVAMAVSLAILLSEI